MLAVVLFVRRQSDIFSATETQRTDTELHFRLYGSLFFGAVGKIDALVAAVLRVAAAGDHVLCMSNGGFGGVHAKLLEALAKKA